MKLRTAALVAMAAKTGIRSYPALTENWIVASRVNPPLAGIGSADTVALTFDDGPDPHSTPMFLKILGDFNVKATFFVLGQNVERYPWLLQEISAAGHEVALHGFFHRNHLFRSARSIRYDLNRAYELLCSYDFKPVWLRPPYGIITRPTRVAAFELGLRTVLWSSWGRDWRREATAISVFSDVSHRFAPGATILLHDSDCTSSAGSFHATLSALPRIIELVHNSNLTFCRISEHGI
jgi:peptidoglycan/xylan/chitin deacetylase (PgdA/CDA1 family)